MSDITGTKHWDYDSIMVRKEIFDDICKRALNYLVDDKAIIDSLKRELDIEGGLLYIFYGQRGKIEKLARGLPVFNKLLNDMGARYRHLSTYFVANTIGLPWIDIDDMRYKHAIAWLNNAVFTPMLNEMSDFTTTMADMDDRQADVMRFLMLAALCDIKK